jgi:hypothetical protein
MLADGIVERHPTLLDELKDCSGSELLGDGAYAIHRPLRRSNVVLDVSQPIALHDDGVAAADDRDGHCRDRTLRQGVVDE